MTGIPAVDVFVIISIVGSGLGLLWKGLTCVFKSFRRIKDFLDDWQGEPARDGVPARPGVMHRLAAIENEVKNNGGGSLKDSVNRIEKELVELRHEFNEHVRAYPVQGRIPGLIDESN